jgi:hypothetical protein
MPTLPNGLKPLVASYSHGGPDGVLRTEVAGGAPRYALDYDRGVAQYNVTLMLDKLQFSVWSAFFHGVIKKGAITFDMPMDSGFGTQTHACNIVPNSYQASRTGGTAMAVSFVVEAESQAYELTGAESLDLVDIYNLYAADTNELLAQIAAFATVHSLVLDF